MGEGERVVKGQHPDEEEEEDRERGANQQNPQEILEIWSWGAGTEGQLGTGRLQDEHPPQFLIGLSNSLSSFGSISLLACGGAHVIALTSSGKVLSWGRGASGQLGHGEVVPNCLYPKSVESLASFRITHVSAGWNHSGFVSDSGCLFTCGDGSFGQLGHGDYQSSNTPLEVSFFRSKPADQIACGMRHSLALLKGNSGHQVYGFGSGKRGQLGVSKDKIKSLNFPHLCSGFEGTELVNISANGDHSAALAADGQLFTWGRGFSGSSDVSVPEALASSLRFKQVAIGWNHALVLTVEGEVFMLGGSHHGVLSKPNKAPLVCDSSGNINKQHPRLCLPDVEVPVISIPFFGFSYPGEPILSKVAGLDGKRIVQIAAGSEHSATVTGKISLSFYPSIIELLHIQLNNNLCVSSSDDGQVCTWGWGEHGQLGLGDTSDQSLPRVVDLGNKPDSNLLTTRVYCGSGFTIAVKMSAPSN
ncbi:hypothetical protein Cgig2_024813 [Carnegiea gigantea]|uniref:RCC1-like domain-containing protein n=1 Tax=Carnegiea gigantea TaxID=171969 RepID=A0A9Q1QH40_9CARY|nr:hypothetical protein Cgig2_024813 [Carnegiea gigantea]